MQGACLSVAAAAAAWGRVVQRARRKPCRVVPGYFYIEKDSFFLDSTCSYYMYLDTTCSF
eukprot:SAG11_NODE_2535_length_3245_cov_11.597584_1_plen_60_part_00